MSGYIPFSQRQKPLPDTYSYDGIPTKLRVQVLHIWSDLWPNDQIALYGRVAYPFVDIEKTMKDCLGLLSLSTTGNNRGDACREFLLDSTTDECLNIIEYSFLHAELLAREDFTRFPRPGHNIDNLKSCIQKLNYRFRENGIGYQFQSSQLVRIDSQLVHTEVTQPALMFLSGAEFATANEQFLTAHKYYREGNLTDAVHYCRKSFESTMKCICIARRYAFDDDRDTASKLVNVLFTNKFFPPMLDSYFANLKGLLESAAPVVVPNKRGSHGPSPDTPILTEEVAAFTMHQIASIILFMAKTHQNQRE